MIYQFSGDQSTDINFPEIAGKTIMSIRFSRWRDEQGNDKGGRIDIEIDDSTAPILYVSDLFVSTPPINPDPEQALLDAITEMEKGEGNPKSMYIMLAGVTKYLKSKKDKLK